LRNRLDVVLGTFLPSNLPSDEGQKA